MTFFAPSTMLSGSPISSASVAGWARSLNDYKTSTGVVLFTDQFVPHEVILVVVSCSCWSANSAKNKPINARAALIVLV
jgi:hypothetical protein